MTGGENSVRLSFSSQAFSFYALASSISLVLLNLEGNFQDFRLLLGIGLAVTALTGFVVFVIDFATRQIRQNLEVSRNNLVMLLLIGIVGLIRGYFNYLGLTLLDFPQYAVLPVRLATSASSTLLWLTLAIYLISAHEESKIEFNAFLRDSFVALSRVETSRSRKIPKSLTPEIQAIEARIQESLSRVYGPMVSQDTLVSVAQQLRDCIENSIRPLSHRLWIQAGKMYPKISIWGLVKESLNRQNFLVISAVSFIALLNSLNLTSTIGFTRSFIATSIIFVVSSAYFHAQRKYLPELTGLPVVIKILNLSAPGLLLSLIFFIINKYIYLDDLGIYNLTFVPICFTVFLLASTIQLMRDDQHSFFQQLQANLSARVDTLGDDLSLHSGKHVATFLHNSVQSELLALSYQLEELSKDPESDHTKAILERLASSLSAQIGKNFENFDEKPIERIKALKLAWAGIAEIHLKSDEIWLTDFELAHEVVQVIEEAITNAVRSAGATLIQISWDKIRGSDLSLAITDNGERSPHGVAGLGTLWLNDIAFGRWSRIENNKETTLMVTFSGSKS